MINSLQHFQTILTNPFSLSPLMITFYHEIGEKRNGLLLAFIVIPLCLHPVSGTALRRLTSASTIRTFVRTKENIAGLAPRIQAYRAITSYILQYVSSIGALKINEDLSIKVLDEHLPPKAQRPKEAQKLANILTPIDVPVIYKTLGVKHL